jgi:hypothetical protein
VNIPVHLALYAAVILIALGLPGLYARQAERARVVGLIGTVLLFFGLVSQSVAAAPSNALRYHVGSMQRHVGLGQFWRTRHSDSNYHIGLLAYTCTSVTSAPVRR